MKKRWIALLAAVCMVVTQGTVFAEEIVDNAPTVKDFSLHKGTLFGDTADEVKEKEEEAGTKLSQDYSDSSSTPIIFYNGTFAGIDNSKLRYAFTNDGILYMMTYMFRDNDDKLIQSLDNQNEEFEHITDELTDRYGSPFFNDGDGTPFILFEYNGTRIDPTGFAQYYTEKELFDNPEYVELDRYNQWIIKTEENRYTLIDHYILRMGGLGYDHWLSYVDFDESTVRTVLGVSEHTSNINDDL